MLDQLSGHIQSTLALVLANVENRQRLHVICIAHCDSVEIR